MTDINLLAVLVATMASFAFGALWYSPLFIMKAWCRAAGVDPAAQVKNPGLVYGLTFVVTFLSALAMAYLLGPQPGLVVAVLTGVVVGVALVSTSLLINYQFASRSYLHWAIDSGFHICRFIVMGIVLGLWAWPRALTPAHYLRPGDSSTALGHLKAPGHPD